MCQHLTVFKPGSEQMTSIDRRALLRGILRGAVVATAGASIMPSVAKSMPLAADKTSAAKTSAMMTEGLVEKAQVVIVNPRRRRRRRWVCWWRRGRRVCGWRWV
jgi:hypothetical protein